MTKTAPIAIVLADVHLSLKCPTARAEEDWLEAQGRYLDQVNELQKEIGCPVVVAGDIFDKFNPSPELINWAIKRMPFCFAVPGQHDLEHHRLEDLRKSAFWTLCEAGKIGYLRPGYPYEVPNSRLRLHGFPWNTTVKPLEKPHDMLIEVAVIHACCWTESTGFEGAEITYRAKNWFSLLRGYDVAVFGDNHKPFNTKSDKKPPITRIHNCGCLIPRRANERDHKPSVGLLKDDGTIERHYLDTSQDKWLEPAALELIRDPRTENLIRALTDVADAEVDFEAAVRRALGNPKIAEGVRRPILQKLGELKK